MSKRDAVDDRSARKAYRAYGTAWANRTEAASSVHLLDAELSRLPAGNPFADHSSDAAEFLTSAWERGVPPSKLPSHGLRRTGTSLISLGRQVLKDAGWTGDHLPPQTRPISSANAVKTKAVTVTVELNEAGRAYLDDGEHDEPKRVWVDDLDGDPRLMVGLAQVGEVVDELHKLRRRPEVSSFGGRRFVADGVLRPREGQYECRLRVRKRQTGHAGHLLRLLAATLLRMTRPHRVRSARCTYHRMRAGPAPAVEPVPLSSNHG